MEKKVKVYCNDCKFHKVYDFDWDECHYPDNYEIKDYPQRAIKKMRSTPSLINKNNDCKWFQPRWKLFKRNMGLYSVYFK